MNEETVQNKKKNIKDIFKTAKSSKSLLLRSESQAQQQ